MHALRETMRSLRSSPVFALSVLITLAYAGLIGLMVALMALRLGFLLPGPFAQMAHFTEPHHRVHDLTFGFLFVPAVAGVVAQLRRPAKNIAGMVMALLPWTGLVLAGVFSGAFARVVLFNPSRLAILLTVLTALLHPTGRGFFLSFSVARVNWLLLALAIVAAVPLLVLASTAMGLQGAAADDHAAAGHYGFVAALAFTVVGVAAVASLRLDGWRLTARVAGSLPILLGAASLLYPDATSSLGLAWALAAIAWGAGFLAAAELTKDPSVDADRPGGPRSRGVLSRSPRG